MELTRKKLYAKLAQHAGVRIDIPYKDLTDKEKNFVLNGPVVTHKNWTLY